MAPTLTTGCLLNCEVKRTLEHNVHPHKTKDDKFDGREVRLARKKILVHYYESRQQWFTATEITTSAAQGCGSCSTVGEMFRNLFPGNEQGLSGEYEYSISLEFVLGRRPLGKEEPVEIIELFQPLGM